MLQGDLEKNSLPPDWGETGQSSVSAGPEGGESRISDISQGNVSEAHLNVAGGHAESQLAPDQNQTTTASDSEALFLEDVLDLPVVDAAQTDSLPPSGLFNSTGDSIEEAASEHLVNAEVETSSEINQDSPIEESVVSATEESAVSATEESEVSTTEESEVSTTEESAVSATEESAVSATEESAVSATEENALTTTEESAVSTTEINPEFVQATTVEVTAFESADQSRVALEELDNPSFAEEVESSEPTMTAEILDGMDTATLVTLLTEACRHAELRTQRDQIMVLRSVLNDRFELEKRRARAEYLTSGGLEEDYSPEPDPLFLLFMDTISKYQQRRQQEREQRDREQADGLRKKEEILSELLRAVEQEENGIQLEPNTIKGLQQRWNEVGLVPAEHRQELWKRFQALIDRFYANLRINRELKELDMQKNLAFKIGLCEQAESLMLMSDLGKALSTLTGIHELWKGTGPVAREQREEVWQRFKLASDRLHDRRRERQAEMDAVLAENLRLKTEIISTLTETLQNGLPTTPVAWNEMGQKVEKLQEEWRATGPVGRERQEEIWSNFRSLLSTFFEQRGHFFKERKQEWGQLRSEAERICATAEELAQSSDWKSATEALLALQEDWKKCNALPHKIKEKYWTRFKTAKDQFFARKKVHFKDQDARHAETRALLESITAEVEAFVPSGEHRADLDALQALQRRWTEAPPLPLRMREAIHNRYRSSLQAHYDKLHASSRAGNPDRYSHSLGDNRSGARRQNQLDRDGRQQDPTARNDRNRLQSKLNDLENDIRLWENNINFFAMSKNADVLRAEVQSKIDQAKKEAERLRAQIAQNQNARNEAANQANRS